MRAVNLIFVLLLVSSVMGKPALDSVDQPKKCGVDSFCTNFVQCENGVMITDGTHLRDIRSVITYECPHYLDVCCRVENILPEVKPKSEPSAAASEDEMPPQCGFRNKQGLGPQVDTVDENHAKFGEFPWSLIVMEKIILLNELLRVYACGASLIRPSVVLTAAHCVHNKDPKTLMIRAGAWNTQSNDESLPFVEVDVESVIIHKDFGSKSGYNDVALLFLKTPLTKENHINTVCLPPQDMEFDNASCFVNGWGQENSGSKYSEVLKKVEFPILSHDNCESRLRKTRLGERFSLHYSFICGGGEKGADMCKGDGGGALVCPIDGHDGYYYQAGIVSWGISCGAGNPGVYVKVSQFRNWIDNQIAEKYSAL